MDEQIDILLATYNGEKYLKEQIDSILNQTYKNIRLIVSDDCSKDETSIILKEYEKTDDRVKVYIQQQNLGVVKNIEFLLNKVESKYYMLSDQDDFWLENKVEKSLEKLRATDADLVFGDLEVVDKDLNTMYDSFGDYMKLNDKIHKYINSDRLNYIYNCVTGCTVLAKKETIDYILPLPTVSKYVIHDYWIGLMVSIHGKVAYMDEKYIKYRQHGNNQVGTEKISHGFNKLDQVRELFINVKLGVFKTYVENNDKFPESMQKLNVEIYNYFKMIENKKNFNFRKWNVFHKLYKTETLKYYVLNFMIMNLPLVARFLFRIRYRVLKMIGKR